MDTIVPYHAGLLLGRAVDMTSLKPGFFTPAQHFEPESHEANLITNKFAFIHSLRDVCDFLDLSPEYALKVKAHVIENETVAACLKTVGNKNAFSFVFRQTFLHKKQYVPHDITAKLAKSRNPYQGGTLQSAESLLADAAMESSSTERSSLNRPISQESHSMSEFTSLQAEALQTHSGHLHSQSSEQESMLSSDAVLVDVPDTQVELPPASLSDTPDLSGDGNVTIISSKSDAVGVSVSASETDTHFVTAQEIGNEQIIILRIESTNDENLEYFYSKLEKKLGAKHGELDHAKLESLLSLAPKLDDKCSKKAYSDVKVDIEYSVYEDMEQYPMTLTGMMKCVETFMDKSLGWKERCRHGVVMKVDQRFKSLHLGDFKEEKSIKKTIMGYFSSDTTTNQKEKKESVVFNPSSDVDNDHDSFIVLDSGSSLFYPMRTTLRSYEEGNRADGHASFTSLALSEFPESTHSLFSKLFNTLNLCDAAVETILKFISTKRFYLENRTEEVNQVLKEVQGMQVKVHDAIRSLNFINVPDDSLLPSVTSADPLYIVESYIENVTSKLPPGIDLDMLMIGKTGHGKSATGNSLLGQKKFLSAADSESVTADTTMGWADVDGRVLKVVDTPGVCDTKESSDEGSIDLAIRSISDAIAHCPQGFNALLLIIRFGARMTDEEKKAIGLLKCVLGQDVVKSHCVCVITHGDNFKMEMKGKQTFEQWCHSQNGFLKSLFEECNYRCVLFNNMAEDPKEKKAQLIQLINKVDSFQDAGTRYTNSIFQFAQQERDRIMAEHQGPQVSEETVRDIQLILDYLNNMVVNTGETSKYGEELASLNARVENLQTRMADSNDQQLGNLVETVFALAGAVHAKMDEIADKSTDPPGACDAEGQGSQYNSTVEPEVSTLQWEGVTAAHGGGSHATATHSGGSPPPDSLFEATEPVSLENCRRNLQDYYNTQVSPAASNINEQVADKVNQQIKSESTCFPGDAIVYICGGKEVLMRDVNVGDAVLVRDAAGRLRYDHVYMFGHHDPDLCSQFVVLTTQHSSVRVSPEHSVYCVRDGREMCLPAAKVTIGDSLLLVESSLQSLSPAAVEEVTWERKRGVFAPFTLSGSVVVDGALMSCYIDSPTPALAHAMLWPTRLLYRVSPKLLQTFNNTSRADSIPWWAKAVARVL